MSWEREGYESHEGVVGVLLADGTEPGPVFFDSSSGASFYESIDWQYYDGSMRRPTAASMRGRCACGWRGEKAYPIDWQQVHRHDNPRDYDTSAPRADWKAHMDDVAARAVPLPQDLSTLLRQVRKRLDHLVDEEDEPLQVLKAADELEAIISEIAPYAASLITRSSTPLTKLAEAYGKTEKATSSRLSHYTYLR
ncbi:hypothetical protein [Streptomyces sp. NPDC094032]|uniref:hypothetical protein n=1 Tax=Streptomyces sp. NPDC094032 TaxID=3155308 RepID=UPI00331CB5F8